MFIYIFIFFLSVAFYLEAPDKYSQSFCTSVFMLFLVSSVLFLRGTFKNKNYFNFHMFFLFSIFFTNFAYPVFIYPTDPEYFSIFTFAFDHNLISQGTAISQLAVISYIIGVSAMKNYLNFTSDQTEINYHFTPQIIKIMRILTMFFTLCFLGHVLYMNRFNPTEEVLNTQIVNVCVIIFCITLIINNINIKDEIRNNTWVFIKKNMLLIGCAALILLSAIWFGDRGPAIQMFFILTFIYVKYVNKIKLRYFIPMIVFGLFLMTMISYTRTSDNNLRSGSLENTIGQASQEMGAFGSLWNYAMDLIINTRNLYVGVELGNRRELLMGKSYFPYLFSPIPGLPSFVTKATFDKTPEEFATSTIITKYTGLEWGVGSNAVGDLYMNFSTPGVVAVFLFFGLFISRLEMSKTIYGVLSFTLIFALVIYYPRSSLLEQLSLIVRGVMILFIIFKMTSNPASEERIKIRN